MCKPLGWDGGLQRGDLKLSLLLLGTGALLSGDTGLPKENLKDEKAEGQKGDVLLRVSLRAMDHQDPRPDVSAPKEWCSNAGCSICLSGMLEHQFIHSFVLPLLAESSAPEESCILESRAVLLANSSRAQSLHEAPDWSTGGGGRSAGRQELGSEPFTELFPKSHSMVLEDLRNSQ
ncbi:hypothetical protein MG293_006874 [Ovis ammon polii]|uniref:Uncharacterized protein n=1 Tax=Ovis ammon polii TaxID=230172 RepID=A0AAD4U978_OVIAM|nr:hypothetical protein MG293_006874 [Ovis ammon polii]KAI4572212.1 hypothetical protein MJT46_005280 [Ovis ammon polii x Ovis aries]